MESIAEGFEVVVYRDLEAWVTANFVIDWQLMDWDEWGSGLAVHFEALDYAFLHQDSLRMKELLVVVGRFGCNAELLPRLVVFDSYIAAGMRTSELVQRLKEVVLAVAPKAAYQYGSRYINKKFKPFSLQTVAA